MSDLRKFEMVLRHVGLTLASAAAIASVVGLIWSAFFLALLPAGAVSPGDLTLNGFFELIAIAGFFGLALLIFGFVVSGLVLLPARASARVPYRADSEIRFLYAALVVSFSVFTVVSSVLRAYRWVPGKLWVLFLVLVAISVFMGRWASRKRPRAWSLSGYIRAAIIVSALWSCTYFVVLGMAYTITSEQRTGAIWPFRSLEDLHRTTGVVYVVIFLTAAALASYLVSRREHIRAAFIPAAALLMLAAYAPHDFFALPYQMLHLANYPIEVQVGKNTPAGANELARRCGALTDPRLHLYRIFVLVTLSSSDIIRCKQGFVRVPRFPHSAFDSVVIWTNDSADR